MLKISNMENSSSKPQCLHLWWRAPVAPSRLPVWIRCNFYKKRWGNPSEKHRGQLSKLHCHWSVCVWQMKDSQRCGSWKIEDLPPCSFPTSWELHSQTSPIAPPVATHWTHLESSDHWWALTCRVELDRCQDIHLFSRFMALSWVWNLWNPDFRS